MRGGEKEREKDKGRMRKEKKNAENTKNNETVN